MKTQKKKRIQVVLKPEISDILANLADRLGISLSSMTERILEEKLQSKPKKVVQNKVNKRKAKFLQRLRRNQLKSVEGIEATVEIDTSDQWYSTFKILLSNIGSSSVDLRGLVVQFPVDDNIKQGLHVNTFNSDSLSYPSGSTVELQSDSTIAVTSVEWGEEDSVDTVLESGKTLEFSYGSDSSLNQAELDSVIAGNIDVSTGPINYTLTIMTPEKPEGVTASACTFSVSGGSNDSISRTLPWNQTLPFENLSSGTYTVKPEDIIEGDFIYQGISKTVELNINSPSETVICEYSAPVESISITLSVDTLYADCTKTVKFVGIDGNTNQYKFPMEGAQKTVRIIPGEYNISASSLTIHETLYDAQFDNPYNLTDDTSINIEYVEATVLVRGWPSYIAQGAVTDNGTQTTEALTRNPVDAIFKYAGDGHGDQGQIVPPTATTSTILASREIEAAREKPVMPVMVVYTINGSGDGGLDGVLNDLSLSETGEQGGYLWKHYVNLCTIVDTLQFAKDPTHPYPGSIVLNPDGMGKIQQDRDSRPQDVNNILNGPIAVNENLTQALQYLEEHEGITIDLGGFHFEDNFKGYVQSLHALIQTVGPDITFGWQVNLWAGGSALWIHDTLSDQEIKTNYSDPLVEFWNAQEIYNGAIKPDFIVFDKWERDGFSNPSRPAGYAFNANDWLNYIVYAKQITESFAVPCMYWQIPGGHMPLVGEDPSILYDDHDPNMGYHFSSAPDFFLGNPGIGTDINNINTEVLELDLDPSLYKGATTVGEYLAQTSGYNWSDSHLEELANNKVFAILWGGGSTTSVVPYSGANDDGGWLADKVKDYYDDPEYLS